MALSLPTCPRCLAPPAPGPGPQDSPGHGITLVALCDGSDWLRVTGKTEAEKGLELAQEAQQSQDLNPMVSFTATLTWLPRQRP